MAITEALPLHQRAYIEQFFPKWKNAPMGKEYFNEDQLDFIRQSVKEDYDFNRDVLDRENLKGSVELRNYPYDKFDDPVFNNIAYTLGDYDYKMNYAPNPHLNDPVSMTITDKYDWNPTYDEFGWVAPEADYTGEDVTLSTLAKFLLNQTGLRGKWRKADRKTENPKLDFLELMGNYLGPRASEGEGRDINFTIPYE